MILVVGATGQLGSMVTRRLLTQNKAVRAFVRQVSPHLELQKAGAEIVFGDLKQHESLARAMQGVQIVVTTATASMRGGADTIDTVDALGTQALIDAAEAAGVNQFVYVSAYGFSPKATNPLARAKGVNEVRLKESGMSYTVLKPVNFMESWIGYVVGSQLQRGRSITIVGDGQVKHGFVAIENVAELAVAVLGDPGAKNRDIVLNGPSAVSYREIIQMIEDATGQTIEVNSVDPGDGVPGMPAIVNELWAMFVEMGNFDIDTAEVARAYGLNPVSVESYIQRTFGLGAAA